MILWVLNAFKNDQDFLAEFQEQYLYFLVDEYQDTNGAQNEILDLLCSYWDRPNLFVVGDDDQAIYRFQGANIGNIQHVINKYDPEVIVLENNYRSNQEILDLAAQFIDRNNERLSKIRPGISKNLIASGPFQTQAQIPQLQEYQHYTQEINSILEQIQKLHSERVPYKEIAVLYRNHRHADELIRVMEQRKIPLDIKRKVNVLKEPLAQQLLDLLNLIVGEIEEPFSQEHLLLKICHFPYFNAYALDLAKISRFVYDHKGGELKLREIISDEGELKKIGVKHSRANFENQSKYRALDFRCPKREPPSPF